MVGSRVRIRMNAVNGVFKFKSRPPSFNFRRATPCLRQRSKNCKHPITSGKVFNDTLFHITIIGRDAGRL
jgi:hypothetical protein